METYIETWKREEESKVTRPVRSQCVSGDQRYHPVLRLIQLDYSSQEGPGVLSNNSIAEL